MSRFRDLPIRLKLTLVIVFTSVVTLSLASLAFNTNDRSESRAQLIANLELLSGVLAGNCASAVTFDDADAARDVLHSISDDPHIMWAVVTLPDGRRFAESARADATIPTVLPALGDGEHSLQNDHLTVTRAVMSGNQAVASLTIRTDLERLSEQASWFIKLSLLVSLAAALVGLVIATLFQRVLSRPLGELQAGARRLAVGDLDFDIAYQSKDEVGQLADTFRSLKEYLETLSDAASRIASNNLSVMVTPRSDKDMLSNSFREMIGNLGGMIRRLSETANGVATAAEKITSLADEMAGGAQDQTDQVNQVTTAITEMAATILQSKRHAEDASTASRNASETATMGGQIVGETVEGMQSIQNVVQGSSESIGDLARSADQIDEIVKVIDDIADQTNLLALNAAIEAARAGEQGRGFAVVADEVRRLAERTGKATDEIGKVIAAVQQKTAGAVKAMESGLDSVQKGRELADQAGQSLQEIVATSSRVLSMIEQIATGSVEQAQVAEDLSQRVETIRQVTTLTAQKASESAGAAKSLSRQAEQLQEVVALFRL